MENTENKRIAETLNEFLADGAPFSLSQEGNGFTSHWRFEIEADGKTLATLRGGVDSTMKDVHTAVVNLLVQSGAMTPKGDEVGWERFIIYQKDWKTEAEAMKDIESKKTIMKWIQK
jgi:hypothetical protein